MGGTHSSSKRRERAPPPRSFHYLPISRANNLQNSVGNERFIACACKTMEGTHYLRRYCRLRNCWLPLTPLGTTQDADVVQLVFADSYSIYALTRQCYDWEISKIFIDQNLGVLRPPHITSHTIQFTELRLHMPWLLMLLDEHALNTDERGLSFFKVGNKGIVQTKRWPFNRIKGSLLNAELVDRELFVVCVETTLPELRCYSIDTCTFELIHECFPEYARQNLMSNPTVYMKGKGNLLVVGNVHKIPLFVFNTCTRRAHVINLSRRPAAIALFESGELLYSYERRSEDEKVIVRHCFLHPPKLQQIALHVLHAHMPKTTYEALITSNVNRYETLAHFLWHFCGEDMSQ